MNEDNTQRFSNRVEDYVRYRPRYPQELIDVLKAQIGLTGDKIVADIGSGTGISSELFLQNGNPVFGVEPNTEMRQAQEYLLNSYKNFRSINGKAEDTTLKDNSVDLIFSAQAFHWFDLNKSKKEFQRILRPDGHIVLVWNERNNQSEFQRRYEKLLNDRIEEYKHVNHKNINEDAIASFFSPKALHQRSLDNKQIFDLESLKGRLRSSSYFPLAGKIHDELIKDIEALFVQFQHDGTVVFYYKTKLFWSP